MTDTLQLSLLHASPQWLEAMREAIDALAGRGRAFTVEDVLQVAGEPPVGTSRNAIGQIMRSAALRGQIRAVGLQISERRSRRGGSLRVWEGA